MDDETPVTGFPGAAGRAAMPGWYPELFDAVSQLVTTGHRRAVSAANAELLDSYWAIGHEILERQHQEGWGARVIDRLSLDLKARFPDVRGYSPRNLKYMRAFARTWVAADVVQGPLARLPWYHQIALMEKLHDAESRR